MTLASHYFALHKSIAREELISSQPFKSSGPLKNADVRLC